MMFSNLFGQRFDSKTLEVLLFIFSEVWLGVDPVPARKNNWYSRGRLKKYMVISTHWDFQGAAIAVYSSGISLSLGLMV